MSNLTNLLAYNAFHPGFSRFAPIMLLPATLAVASNIAIFAVLFKAAHVHHLGAAVLSFCVAVTNNFLLNRSWTFRDARGGHAGFQAARFFAVSVAGLGVNLLVLYGLVDIVNASVVPSQAIAVAVAMPLNFVGNKLWTFSDSARRSPP